MPIQPTYPGVYIQEISSGVRTITGVATSIAAFIGRTAKGPINKAVRCTSYSDFLRNFSGAHPASDLADSVKQFYDNGGSDCYVVRIANGALPAKVTLRRFPTAAANGNVLTASAKSEGVWGQNIKLDVDYNTPNPDDTFNLKVSNEENGVVIAQETHINLSMNPNLPRFAPNLVTQSSKLINLKIHADMGDPNNPALPANLMNQVGTTPPGYSQSRVFTGTTDNAFQNNIKDVWDPTRNGGKSRFIINVNRTQDIEIDLADPVAPLDLSAEFDPNPGAAADSAADAVAIGDAIAAALQAFINPRLQAEVAGLRVAVTWNVIDDRIGVFQITSDSGDFSSVTIRRAATNDIATSLMLGLEQGGIEVARYSNLRPIPNGVFFWGDSNFGDFTDAINAFAALNQNAINQITLGGVLVAVDLVTTLAGQRMFQNTGGGADGVLDKLGLIRDAVNASANSPVTAELWKYHLVFKLKTGALNESTTVASAGSANFGNDFVRNVKRYSLGGLGTGAFQSEGLAGSDGVTPTTDDFEGSEATQTGFYALDKVDLFNLMVIPNDLDIEDTFQLLIGPASIYCSEKRAFLIIDAPKNWTDGDLPTANAATVNTLRAGIVKDHTAIYYPRVQFNDAGIKKYIGASGMIAGLMARTDSQRGVWKAPAGVEADLRGVLDVELNLTDNQNGVLNKLGVNCIRKFPNGIVSWGARTLDGSDDFGSEWKYIPIRRLALFLEESLYRGTKWVVFEPNDEPLWAKIRLNITAFMMSLFRQGAFQGTTPDKAFFVKCDAETTTQNDRNLGIVNIQVGFAPLKPAEFVIITIQQMAGDLV